jgi:serine/threonine protein kinase
MTSKDEPILYPPAGETIDGKYLVERMLGEGGMGAVAKATHILRRAPVALKFMSPNVLAFPGAVERFVNEAVAASQIDSDHVVKIFDVGKLPMGAPYLVMEYLEGRDLSDLLAREGAPWLDVPRSIHFTLQILRGLQVAHAAGIVHRDMKPANCFIVLKDGEPDFLKLVDFGISKVQQPGGAALTQANSALGTPLYMSPEQAKSPRDVDLRSDLYSVGVILYELLTARTPFTSESGELTEILFKIFTQDPPRLETLRPDLPPGLADAVHGALVREPERRFATAGDMAEALAPFADARSQSVLGRIRSHGRAPLSQVMPQGGAPANAPPTDVSPKYPISPAAHTAAPASALPMSAIPHSVVQPAGGPALTGDEVTAQTQFGDPNESTESRVRDWKFLAPANTDLGSTRDTPGGAPSRSRAPLFVGVLVVLAVAAFGAVKMQSKPSTVEVAPTRDPVGTLATQPSSPVVPVAVPPQTTLAPTPSSNPTVDASAVPTAVAPVGQARPKPVAPSPAPSARKLQGVGIIQ